MKIKALVFVAVLAGAPIVHAADPLPTEIALARRLFAEARVAEDAKDWQTAANKLREAIAIKETAGLRFHLAYCEEQQGMLVEALVDYERSDDLPGSTNDDFRAQLPAKRESLHRRIPTVNLMLPPEAKNVTLTVDGHTLPTSFLGKPVPLNPGRHVFAVTSPDFQRFTTELTLKETDAVVTNALLKPVQRAVAAPGAPDGTASTPSAPRETADVESSGVRTAVLIGEAAVLVSGLAVGIGATLAQTSKDAQIRRDRSALGGSSACHQPTGPNALRCQELDGNIDEQRTYVKVSALGFAVAGVGLLGFATTLLLWPATTQGGTQSTTLLPFASPEHAGISISGQF
jgi:hypothetical protein